MTVAQDVPEEADQSDAAADDESGGDDEETAAFGPEHIGVIAIMLVGLVIGALAIIFTVRRPRFLDRHGRPHALSILDAVPPLVWYFLLVPIVAVLVLSQTRLGIWRQSDNVVMNAAIGQMVVHLITAPILLLWWRGMRRTPHRRSLYADDDRSPRSWTSCVLVAVGALLATWPTVLLVNNSSAWIRQMVTGEEVDSIAHSTLVVLQSSTGDAWTWILIASVVIVSPLFEEVIFRGTLQNMFRGFSPSSVIVIIAASAVFALRHYSGSDGPVPLEALPGLFVLAVGMGAAYVWTGRIITPVIMHALFNAGNIALLFLLHGES